MTNLMTMIINFNQTRAVKIFWWIHYKATFYLLINLFEVANKNCSLKLSKKLANHCHNLITQLHDSM
jgi:hypothetical protein